MSSIEVTLVNVLVELHVIDSDCPKKQVIALDPETAIGIGSALIQAGRDAMTNPN